MNPSAELRWFFRQHVPDEVKEWFCGAKLCKQESARTDHYLVFSGSNEVGVKVRAGSNLEIKARVEAPGPFTLASGASVGRQDAWVKWSLADAEVAARLAALDGSSSNWVPVGKKRWLRKFSIGPTGNIEETDPDSTVDRGCIIELAEVNLSGSYWWTIAFESFGEDSRAAGLEQVARHFLKMLPHGLALTERDSMAYPEWLSRMAG